MHEVIITAAMAVQSDHTRVETRVIRIEFDNETSMIQWLNRCADGESPMMQGLHTTSPGIRDVVNIETLHA